MNPDCLNLILLDSELSLAFVFLSLWGCRLRIFSVFYPFFLSASGDLKGTVVTTINDYQAKFYAHELRRSYADNELGKLTSLLFDAQVEPKPHQIDVALFALQSPHMKGAILADEVGLGKTIEAGIVITQFWSERRRNILIVAPASLRQQWKQELWDKFMIPATLVDSKNAKTVIDEARQGEPSVLVCSYQFMKSFEKRLASLPWNLMVLDEAHYLRNFYLPGKKQPKTALAASKVAKSAQKVLLLTATPLHNKLEELYGLVSVIDPEFFDSLKAFRARYTNVSDELSYEEAMEDLRERLNMLLKRHLRQDVNLYVRYTNRGTETFKFEPTEQEKQLYEMVQSFIHNSTFMRMSPARSLMTIQLFKRLGSSTFAAATTLDSMAKRLQSIASADVLTEKEVAAASRSFAAVGADADGAEILGTDSAGTDSTAAGPTSTSFVCTTPDVDRGPSDDEWLLKLSDDSDSFSDRVLTEHEMEELRKESAELSRVAKFAASIRENAKAYKLLEALERGFESMRAIGAPEKAIIFTESTRTQDYLKQVLTTAGYGDELVLFNGSNASKEQRKIYREWLKEHEGSDLVTGVQAADTRKALVDKFRNSARIMIATEAAGEGINLQFCSLLVNYDLPWNPQRVEQRIGRVHRYGQKHDVLVINFLNTENVAESRVLSLLTDKFQIFTGVFGASNEILGAIAYGADFDRKIGAIFANAKTAEEIEEAFRELEEENAELIAEGMRETSSKVFENLDTNVQDKLKHYDEGSRELLGVFERLLMEVTKHELADSADFADDSRRFVLREVPAHDDVENGDIVPGTYALKEDSDNHTRQYRFDSPLGRFVVDSALNRETPQRELVFSVSASERPSKYAQSLVGTSGELSLREATYTASVEGQLVQESYLVAGGFTDSGEPLTADDVNDLMSLRCVSENPIAGLMFADRMESQIQEQMERLAAEVNERNGRFLEDLWQIQDARAQDIRAEAEAEKLELLRKERQLAVASRREADLSKRMQMRVEARKLNKQVSEVERRMQQRLADLDVYMEDTLDRMKKSKDATSSVQDLFTIRWRVEQ